MANRKRGETEIGLDGTVYILKLDMQAMVEAEEKSGLGLFGMAIRIDEKRWGIREAAALVYAGFLGAKRAGSQQKCPTYEELLEIMTRVGFVQFHLPAATLIGFAMRGLGTDREELEMGKSEPAKEAPTPT
jgi:hypothetical protein